MISLIPRKTFLLLTMLLLLAGAFLHVMLRSGPLAPVPVVVFEVRERSIQPSLFGIGAGEARSVHHIGPTAAGRVLKISVDVGDKVEPGQIVGEMDPVDMDERLIAQESALLRAAAAVQAANAHVGELRAKATYAESQARRFGTLVQNGAVSKDAFEAHQEELHAARSGLESAQAAVASAQHEYERLKSEARGISRQREMIRLITPVAGLVTKRLAESGTTVVAGESVLEIVEPQRIWINARFDQLRASGLKENLATSLTLRSRSSEPLRGKVKRVEPVADAVTEELLAKIVFDSLPDPLPALGELAEVTVELPELPPAPTIPASCVVRNAGTTGVWVTNGSKLDFVPVTPGASDLDGLVQIRTGLRPGQWVVSHSSAALAAGKSIKIVDRIPGTPL